MRNICCLTSYPDRILNCYRVVGSLLDNTVVPDRIYLTLSLSQFPDSLYSLPPLLRKLCVESPVVHLNWVDVDTRIMKRVIPVLQFMEEDDLIFCIDDDIIYPHGYIESRLQDFRKFNYAPLTGCTTQNGRTLWENWRIPSSMGKCCVFQKKHIANIDKFVDESIIAANNDDGTYSMVEWLNGYDAHDVGEYGMDWLDANCTFNETNPAKLNGSYLHGNGLLEKFRFRICELTGMDIFDGKSAEFSKGFFKLKNQ